MSIGQVVSAIDSLPSKLRRITTSSSYRPEIDGLRFFAIAGVVIGHFASRVDRFFSSPSGLELTIYNVIAGMEGGVFLFFSISGFIIASQALRSSENPLSAKKLKPYFSRRVTRIEPPYFILLVATFLAISLLGLTPPDAARYGQQSMPLSSSLIASLLYSHGWFYGTTPKLFAPGWTLEVEVQFYILAPLIFYACFYATALRRRMIVNLAGLALSIVASGLVSSAREPHLVYTIVRFLPYFWLGLVLADINQRCLDSLQRIPAAVLSAGGWLGAAIFFLVTRSLPFAPQLFLGLFSIALMFLGAFTKGSFRGFCARPWISLLGGACYSIYLTHLQVLHFGTYAFRKLLGNHAPHDFMIAFLLAVIPMVAVTALAGLVFYAFIERPFMIVAWPAKLWNYLRGRFRADAPAASPPDALGIIRAGEDTTSRSN
jgi:peptidoglycan/LPS O-acetylase OafA/YrhL